MRPSWVSSGQGHCMVGPWGDISLDVILHISREGAVPCKYLPLDSDRLVSASGLQGN
jgi:hypothetical protein